MAIGHFRVSLTAARVLTLCSESTTGVGREVMERDLGQPYRPGMNIVGMMGEGPRTTGIKRKFSFRAGGGGPFSLLAGCNGKEDIAMNY